jgi:CDP-glucose 4,6-dehydratase
MISKNTFEGKVVIVTGNTGFKGAWLTLWLKKLGAIVTGVSIDVPTSPSLFNSANIHEHINDVRLDIRDKDALNKLINKIQPDFVFHLAAQALVKPSYDDPITTITTNAIGSANVLDCLRSLDKQVVAIMITSDKAYDNVEWPWGYRETDLLGGKDPYSASKGMAELAIRCYVESFFKTNQTNISVGIVRAGNVIGGGDWASHRIVPDCMKAWSINKIVDIRSPLSTRPWQHVLEPLSGYLLLAESLANKNSMSGEAYNFGPAATQNKPVSEIIDEMAKYWQNVSWNDVSKSENHVHEAGLLKLNCDKALHYLNWLPTLDFKETVRMTVEWYKEFYENKGSSMFEYSSTQIEEYLEFARKTNINSDFL